MTRHLAALAATLLFASLTHAAPSEKLPPNAKLTRIEATPAAIDVRSPFEYAQIIITGTLHTGERIDVTRMVTFAGPEAIKISDTAQVRPVADGKGKLVITLGDQKLELPINVSGQKDKVEVSYVRDVMPLIARLGCNAGTCHGAEAGRGGFKLSLRGYDPLHDYRALTDDLFGRRFNRAAPDTSLMLLKTVSLVTSRTLPSAKWASTASCCQRAGWWSRREPGTISICFSAGRSGGSSCNPSASQALKTCAGMLLGKKRRPPSCGTRASAFWRIRLVSGPCRSVRRPSTSRVSWR